MPIIDCELADLTTGSGCANKGGIKVAYWTLYSYVDWAATLADATPLFDQTTQTISGFTMVATNVWNKISFKRKGSFYTQSYTEDNQFYDTQITNIFEGKGATLRNALTSAINCCNIVYYLIDNNGNERLFGVDWDGVAFNPLVEPMKIRQHDDNSGDFGGDSPSDVVIFGGESETPALYGDITQATFESTYL